MLWICTQTFSQYPHQPVTIAPILVISNRITWIQFKWLMRPTFPLLCDNLWHFHHAHRDRNTFTWVITHASALHCMDLSLLHQDQSCQPHQTHHTHQQMLRLSQVIFSIMCVLFDIPSLFRLIQLDQTQAHYCSHVYTSVTCCTSLHQLEIAAPSPVISSE